MSDTNSAISTTRYEQSPARFFRPNTGQEERHVYVLTLKMTPSIAQPMNDMRREHFPAHLNRTPAHLTLFHALPHGRILPMLDKLNAIATYAKPFPISTGTPFRMGRGVGIGLGEGAKDCIGLHDALRAEWFEVLSEQDQGGWKPHWTVMNKVSDEKKVKAAFNTIRRDLFENTYHGLVVGLDLWRYVDGRWEWAKDFNFVGNGKVDDGEALQVRHRSVSASATDGGGSAENEENLQGTKNAPAEADVKRKKSSVGIKDLFKSMSVRRASKKDNE